LAWGDLDSAEPLNGLIEVRAALYWQRGVGGAHAKTLSKTIEVLLGFFGVP